MASLSLIAASFGRCCESLTPGILVSMAVKEPPVGVPGLGSKVSMWLGPPSRKRRMQAWADFFTLLFSSAALSRALQGEKARAAAPARLPTRKSRRGVFMALSLQLSRLVHEANATLNTAWTRRLSS